ncbi:MAG: pitrilysin family protein [Flavobacteriales bacterium]
MKKITLILASAFLLGNSFAQKNNIKFTEFDLDNGLHVVLHKDNSTPIIAVSVLYHVGSKNEVTGKTGYAHFFEHLMFEESENIAQDQYAKIVQSVGGTINAYTSSDQTYYHCVLPSNQLELGLWMESERMLNAKITQAGVDNQREVVKEEKRTSDNRPYSSWYMEISKRMFAGTNYEWTPIGSFADLNAASIADFQNFYDTYYVPNNATLVITGDIDEKAAKKYIKKYFSSIPKGSGEINRPKVSDALLTKAVVDTVYDNIQLDAVFQAYKVPAQGTKDAYALEMLSTILSNGKSSRLNTALKEDKQMALQVAGFSMNFESAGFFATLGLPNQGYTVSDIQKGIVAEIEKLQNELISEEEFQKIKNISESNFVSSNSSMKGIAESLATYHVMFGDAELINTELEKYRAVTREDIQRVAKKYLVRSNSVTLYYLPKK